MTGSSSLTGMHLMQIMMPVLQFEMTEEQRQRRESWNSNLRRPYPMAPAWMTEQGLINDINYAAENRSFSTFQLRHLRAQYAALRNLVDPSHPFDLQVKQFGSGEGGDIEHIVDALSVGLKLVIYEISDEGMEKTIKLLNELREREPDPYRVIPLEQYQEILQWGDMVTICTEDGIDPLGTVFVYISRIIQHYEKSLRDPVLRGMGRLFSEPGRRILLIHPLPEDNPRYRYVTSEPIPLPDILDPLQAGAEKDLVAEGVKEDSNKHHYFSQLYTAIVIREP